MTAFRQTSTIFTPPVHGEGAESLNQKTDPLKAAGGDPYKADLAQQEARRKTLRTLNAVKIVAPIISALMCRPGVDAEGGELTVGFRQLIKETSDMSEYVCANMGIDPKEEKNYWLRNVFERLFAELYGEQWELYGKTSPDFIRECVKLTMEKTDLVGDYKNDIDLMTPEITIRVALFKSVVPVIQEAKTSFHLFRDVPGDIEHIANKIKTATDAAVESLADDITSPADRAALFSIVSHEAGKIYAISWKAEAKRVLEICKDLGEEKVKEWVSRNPGGLPLTKVDYHFDEYVEKLKTIAERLIPTKKGPIEKRLKTAPSA